MYTHIHIYGKIITTIFLVLYFISYRKGNAMKKKALTITFALFAAAGILIALLIASIGYFSGQILSTSKQDEDIYFTKLYTISSDLINADRDFYQSEMAAIQYHDLAFADSGIPAETLAELLPGYR